MAIIVVSLLASIASGLFISYIIEEIGNHIEKRRALLSRLHAAQKRWAELADAEEIESIAYLYLDGRNRAA